MLTQSNSNEMSQSSHEANDTSNKHESPQSIDSSAAREIRGKPFTHNKQQTYKPVNIRHSPPSAPSNNNNTRPVHHREYYKKRNSRHVNLLDHRSQQPVGKKPKQGQPAQSQFGHSSHDSAPGEFVDNRRHYRLRSFTADRPNRK